MIIKCQENTRKFMSIDADNYNSVNTMKGILVISPSKLIFDQYVHLIKWDLWNKIWRNIDENLIRNE